MKQVARVPNLGVYHVWYPIKLVFNQCVSEQINTKTAGHSLKVNETFQSDVVSCYVLFSQVVGYFQVHKNL